eukprot:TRINITY_DN21155_c0_g1_i2.p1 TRINITY_DN21155_c0_g1~~TRINITY_DN21155_c0_g1_i2.p1  ORF type:complete len:241 (+),score=42.73 TRINITY_DN21155_c0_g1_i2:67-789(+)
MGSEDGGGIADASVNAMGAINALRTGNVIFDMMVAMLIPVIFRAMFSFMGDFTRQISSGELRLDMLMFWKGSLIERVIEHKATQNMYGEVNTDRDTRNNILMKAIQLYLDHREIKWKRSRVSLTSMAQTEQRPWWYGGDDNERSPAAKLKKYRISQAAPNHTWEELGIWGGKSKKKGVDKDKDKDLSTAQLTGGPAMVELRVEESEEDKGEKGEKTVSTMRFRFRSRSEDAIDAWWCIYI